MCPWVPSGPPNNLAGIETPHSFPCLPSMPTSAQLPWPWSGQASLGTSWVLPRMVDHIPSLEGTPYVWAPRES